MKYLFIVYLIGIVILSFYISKKKRFYIFSPFIVIYLSYAVSDIIPLLMYKSPGDLPKNIYYVTTCATTINIAMIFLFRKDMLKEMRLSVPNKIPNVNKKRAALIGIFTLILMLAGLYTGVITSILSGRNVENLRRTSEIGMGFVTLIPYFAVYLLVLQSLFSDKKMTVIKAGIFCLSLGFLLFLTNAARAQILMGVSIFLIWFNIKCRSLKWYEYYVVFFVISPIVATVLYVLRHGSFDFNINEILFNHQNMIFTFNTKNLMALFEGTDKYLWGMSYLVPMTTVIPIFLWPDKPVSIDYYYKDITNMEFDGGGIYTTTSMDMYMNFGLYFAIFYIVWLLFIHYLYRLALSANLSEVNRVSILYFLTLFVAPGNMIAKFEIYILFLIICRFYYGKAKII